MKKQARSSSNPAGRPRSAVVTDKLHAAVLALSGEGDFASLSMEAVAERAGVTRSALYRRYPNLGEMTLGALLAYGAALLPMTVSDDLSTDLQTYLRAVAASLRPHRATGRALRGLLAHALTHAAFAPTFTEFLDRRRSPVVDRLLQHEPNLPRRRIESLVDRLFGPVLYRLLIRQRAVSGGQIDELVDDVVQIIGERRR